jgi:intracellular septation protein A
VLLSQSTASSTRNSGTPSVVQHGAPPPAAPSIGEHSKMPLLSRSAATGLTQHVIHLPPIRELGRRAAENVLEATLVPLALFYLFLSTVGLRGALVAALCWSYAAVGRRIATGQRMPGLLVLATILVTVRFCIAMSTGSTFVYFLQPTLGTFLVAGVFLASVSLRKPLAQRLAHDFCALPESLTANLRVQRFFAQISLLWALVYLVNGSTTLYLLMHESVGTFLLLKFVISTTCPLSAIAASAAYFFKSLREENIVLRWHRPDAVAAA